MARDGEPGTLYHRPVQSLRLLYLALGAATASVPPFLSVILSSHGLDSLAVGAVNSVSAICFVAAIAGWGHIGDRLLGRRATLRLSAVLAATLAVGVGMPVPPAILALLVIAFVSAHSGLQALGDAVTVNALPHPERQYGQIRLMASLSFAVATIVVGFVADQFGYAIASAFYVCFAGLLIIASSGLPAQRPDRRRAPADAQTRADAPATPNPDVSIELASIEQPLLPSRFGSTGEAFRAQPRLLPVLATVAVTWTAVTVSFSFLTLRIVAVGGQPRDVALSFGVSAFAEIPGMIIATRLAPRVGLSRLFCLGAIAYGAAFASWTILDAPAAIVATRVVTGVAYGAMTVATVLTIGRLLPANLQATGQALNQGTAMGLASVLGNSLAGLLYGPAGAPALFAVCAALCVAGGLMALTTLPGRLGPPGRASA